MKRTLLYILPPLMALLLAACSDSSQPEQPADAVISFGIGGQTLTLDWMPETGSRANPLALPDLPAPIAAKPADIGVWGFNDLASAPVFSNRRMIYIYGPKYAGHESELSPWPAANEYPYVNPEKWNHSVPGTPSRYKFFGYSPWVETEGYPDTDDVLAYAESYDGFYAFVWHLLPTYSDVDYLASSNVLCYTSSRAGQRNPKQVLEMEHLYSRLRFCFILGPRFGDVREIHLKEVTISSLPANRVMFTATLTPLTGPGGEPLTDAAGNPCYSCSKQWSNELPSSENSVSITLNLEPEFSELPLYQDPQYPALDADNAVILSARNREHFGYIPMGSLYAYTGFPLQGVELNVKYDVYDKEGLLLRKDQTASNWIDLDLQPAGSLTGRVLQPSHYYDVKIEIEPKYLYVMSDNDVCADGKIIIQ